MSYWQFSWLRITAQSKGQSIDAPIKAVQGEQTDLQIVLHPKESQSKEKIKGKRIVQESSKVQIAIIWLYGKRTHNRGGVVSVEISVSLLSAVIQADSGALGGTLRLIRGHKPISLGNSFSMHWSRAKASLVPSYKCGECWIVGPSSPALAHAHDQYL